jgi:hypothetical protein
MDEVRTAPKQAAKKPKGVVPKAARGTLRKGTRVNHPSRGGGRCTGTWNGGQEVSIKYDTGDEMDYDMKDALAKLEVIDEEPA